MNTTNPIKKTFQDYFKTRLRHCWSALSNSFRALSPSPLLLILGQLYSNMPNSLANARSLLKWFHFCSAVRPLPACPAPGLANALSRSNLYQKISANIQSAGASCSAGQCPCTITCHLLPSPATSCHCSPPLATAWPLLAIALHRLPSLAIAHHTVRHGYFPVRNSYKSFRAWFENHQFEFTSQ